MNKWLQQGERRRNGAHTQFQETPDEVVVFKVLVLGSEVHPHGIRLHTSADDGQPPQTQRRAQQDLLDKRHLHPVDNRDGPECEDAVRRHVCYAIPKCEASPDFGRDHLCVLLLVEVPVGP